MNRNMNKKILLAFLACAVALVVAVATTLAQNEMMMKPMMQDAPRTMMKEGLGTYLTDGRGMTLYSFAKDKPGASACSGNCIKNWPAYSAGKVEPMAGMNAQDFGTITREDGTRQTTYKGYPLYYFIKDQKPGDTNGQGVIGAWFVVDPAKFPPKM